MRNHIYPSDEAIDEAHARVKDEFRPGMESCCVNCKSRVQIVDEDGTSWECHEENCPERGSDE